MKVNLHNIIRSASETCKEVTIYVGHHDFVYTAMIYPGNKIDFFFEENCYDVEAESRYMPTLSEMGEDELFQFMVFSNFGEPNLGVSVQKYIIENINFDTILDGVYNETVEY
jgi:hypothetical protein